MIEAGSEQRHVKHGKEKWQTFQTENTEKCTQAQDKKADDNTKNLTSSTVSSSCYTQAQNMGYGWLMGWVIYFQNHIF